MRHLHTYACGSRFNPQHLGGRGEQTKIKDLLKRKIKLDLYFFTFW